MDNNFKFSDETFIKKILRLIILFIYIIFAIGSINILINYSSSSSYSKISSIIELILFVFFSIIVFKKVLNKNGRKSMSVMKRFCSYNELKTFLDKEEFKELKNCGIEKIFASKLWLRMDGVFIPKNFIVGAYVDVAVHGTYELRFILINGKQYFYRVGCDKSNIVSTLNSVKASVSHFKLYDNVFKEENNIFKELQKIYDKKIKSGVSIESLINKWDEDFNI